MTREFARLSVNPFHERLMEDKKKVEQDRAKPNITTLAMNLGDAVDFRIDPNFNQDIPIQIHCRSCGAHLRVDWRYNRLTYHHDRLDWCQAPRLYAVSPHKVLDAAFKAILEKTPSDPDATIYARLKKWIMYVNVEARSHDDCAIHVQLNAPEDVKAA